MKLEKLTRRVFDLGMAYVEVGSGDPIVFLHGNPTSSYLWRGIIPHVAEVGRCIAPDLIGMGDSAKLADSGPGAYRYVQHRRYLDELLRLLDVRENVTLVGHDWGAALAFDWAVRHPDSVRGLAYMEAIVTPLTWNDWPPAARPIFRAMRSEAGEEIVMEKNVFIDRILPASIMRDLAADEMDEYRRPYRQPGEDRRPTLTWPRQIPIEGDPPDVHAIVENYAARLATWDVPKLFINADPGSILVGRAREVCRLWPNQTEVTVPGVHFIQEDSPERIGAALADWRQDATDRRLAGIEGHLLIDSTIDAR